MRSQLQIAEYVLNDLDFLDELLDLWGCISYGSVEAFDFLERLSELDTQRDHTNSACSDAERYRHAVGCSIGSIADTDPQALLSAC